MSTFNFRRKHVLIVRVKPSGLACQPSQERWVGTVFSTQQPESTQLAKPDSLQASLVSESGQLGNPTSLKKI